MKMLFIVFTLITFVSCTEKEEKFSEVVKNLQVEREKLEKHQTSVVIDVDFLTLLKRYSDLVQKGHDILKDLSKSKKSRKRISKYLLKESKLEEVCSSLLINNEFYSEIKSNCNEGFFDICPVSFSKFQKNTMTTIANLKAVLGEDDFQKTDCTDTNLKEL